jgi:hypothetical protein
MAIYETYNEFKENYEFDKEIGFIRYIDYEETDTRVNMLFTCSMENHTETHWRMFDKITGERKI